MFNQVPLKKNREPQNQKIMSFNGTEGDPISLTDAATMTEEFRTQNEGATKGHFFGKEILNDILAQKKCVGIRFYNGIDASGAYTLIAAGADTFENDQIGVSDTIAEYSKPCPPSCGTANDLNS